MAAGGKEMEIAIKIAGKVESSFKNALSAATKGLGSITKAAAGTTKGVAKGMGAITKVVAGATAAAASAVGAMGIAAINTGREFEGAMSQVAATMLIDKNTAEGQKAFETLENAARECGKATAFSATEAAEALNYLALAGYDADKAATALPTVLKLAGAGAMDLASASDMVTDSMSALGIEATEEKLTQFSDQLAQTASKSNTSVAQLGEAILTVGGTAKGLAGETTELNASLGILADNGIKAAEGGTHLRNMILSLQSPRNDKAATMFENMGLSAYDAEGKMRSLGDVFGDINHSLEGASAEKVNDTLSTIFKQTDLASARAMLAATVDSVGMLGSVVDASLAESGTSMATLGINLQEMANQFDTTISQEEFAAKVMEQFGLTGEQAGTIYTGLQSVLNGTGNRFGKLSADIENSAGACENMYAIQLDNLDGDISQLKSGLSDLGISVYKDLNGPLREATQSATSMVKLLSEAYESGGMESMVSAAGGCMAKVINEIAEYAPQVVNMGVNILENFVSGITENSGVIADAAANVITTFVKGLFTLVPQVIFAGIDIIMKLVSSATGQLPQLISAGTQAIVNFITGIIQRLPEIADTALEFIQTLRSSLIENTPQLIEAAGRLFKSLFNGFNAQLPKLISSGTQSITNIVTGIVQHLPAMIATALTLVQTLVNSIGQNAPMLIAAAVQLIGNLILGIGSMLPQLLQMGIQLILNLAQGLISNLPFILQMGVQVIMNFVSGITQMLPMLIQGGIQLIISLVQGIIANLGNIANSAVQIIITLATGLIQAIPQLIAAIPQLIGALIDAIFETDWLQVGIDIIKGLIDGIMSTGKSLWNAIKSLFTGGGDDIPDAPDMTSAANSMASVAFSGVDTSGATAAGNQTGAAFTAGLNDSMASGGLDTTVFNANMTTLGVTGAEALNNGLNTGFAETPIDTNGILDATAFSTDMTAAGTTGAAALTTGFNTGLSDATINASGLTADTSGLTTTLTAAGADGAAAIGTGINENSQAVTQAATTMGNNINTALDSGWNKANTNAQTAMQRMTTTVTNAARSAASAVKAAFENMTITIPKPKIPVITVSTSSTPYGDGGNVSVPNFSVSWNALGGIFDRPTIFNTPAGMQGVGEAGPEAVLPLDTLWAKMKGILNEAIAANGGVSIIDTFIERLKGIGTGGGGGQQEFAGAGGPNIVWNPTYNLYGSAGKEEVVEADRISQAEFNRLMKQYEKDQRRRKL